MSVNVCVLFVNVFGISKCTFVNVCRLMLRIMKFAGDSGK